MGRTCSGLTRELVVWKIRVELERAVLLDHDAMLVKPAFELVHEVDTIRAPRQPLFKPVAGLTCPSP